MSEAEKRADLLQQADLDLDEIEALMFSGTRESLGKAYDAAEKLAGQVRLIPLSTEKSELLAGGADALMRAMEDVHHERLMGGHFCNLVRRLLEDCAND